MKTRRKYREGEEDVGEEKEREVVYGVDVDDEGFGIASEVNVAPWFDER